MGPLSFLEGVGDGGGMKSLILPIAILIFKGSDVFSLRWCVATVSFSSKAAMNDSCIS